MFRAAGFPVIRQTLIYGTHWENLLRAGPWEETQDTDRATGKGTHLSIMLYIYIYIC